MYNKLLLSGGGIKGIAELGALHYFRESGHIENLEVVAGTSIGSVIGLLFVCGYEPIELFSEVYNSDHLLKPRPQEFLQIFIKMGLMDIRSFTERVYELVEVKLGVPNPTLRELYELTKIKFVACSSDISAMDTTYISYETHPDLGCVNAVEYSCNLPVIFQRLKCGDHFMADGAVTNNFPIEALDVTDTDRVLGIAVFGADDSFEASNPAGYLYRMIQMSINSQTTLRVKILRGNPNSTIIRINCPSGSIFNIQMTDEAKMDLFRRGYDYSEMEVESVDLAIDKV